MPDATQSLILKIGGDPADAVRAINEIIGALNGLVGTFPGVSTAADNVSATAGSMQAALNLAFTDPLAALGQLSEAMGSKLLGAIKGLGEAGEFAASGLGVVAGAAIAVGGTVFALADHAANAGESVLEFSQKTGIAVGNVGALQFSVQAAGGSLESLTSLFRMLDMKQATDQGGKFSAALKDIGINANAFKQMDSQQQLYALAAGFQEGAKSGNTMADAITLMGRAGSSQIPMLMKLTGDLIETGKQLGIEWTTAEIVAAEKFKVSLNTIETAMGNISTKVGMAVVPALADMMASMAKSKGFVDDLTTATSGLSHVLGYLVEAVGYVGTGLIALFADLVGAGAHLDSLSIAIDQFFIKVMQGMAKIPGMGKPAAAEIANLGEQIKVTQADLDKSNAAYNEAVRVGGAVYDVSMKIGGALVGVGDSAAKASKDLIGVFAPGLMASINAMLDDVNRRMGEGGVAGDAYRKAVDAIVASLEGESKKTRETSQAISEVIAEGDLDVETKTRVVAAIEKLIAGHIALTAAQKTFYEQNIDLNADTQKVIAQTTKLTDDYNKTVQAGVANTLEAKLAANQAWYDNELKTLVKAKAGHDVFEAGLDALLKDRQAKDDAARAADTLKQQAFQDATNKLWDESYSIQEDADQSALDKKLSSIAAWYESQRDALDKSGANSQEWHDRVLALDADLHAKQRQAMDQELLAQQKAYEQSVVAIENSAANLLMSLNGGWTSFGQGVKKVLTDILDYFENSFVKGLIGSMLGQQGAFENAFAGLFGGATSPMGGGQVTQTPGLLGLLSGAGGFGGLFGGGSDIKNQVNATADQASGSSGGFSLTSPSTLIGGGLALGGITDILQGGNSTVGGMTTGAGIGTMIMPGIGTAIGAGIGALAGWIGGLFGGGPSASDVSSQFYQGVQGGSAGLATQLSPLGGVGTTLQSSLDNAASADEATAAVAKITDTLKQLAGQEALSTQNADALLGTIREGGPAAAAAVKAMDTAFQNLAANGVDAVGLWSKAMKDFVDNVQSSGAKVDSVTKALQAQVQSSSDGLNGALGITKAAMDAAAADQQTIATSTGAAADKAKADLIVQQGIIDATSIKSQDAAQGVAGAIFATVAANEKLGMSFADAIRATAPAINGLQAQLTRMGFDGGEAFKTLSDEAKLVGGAVSGPALTAVEGYTKAVVGLSNAGLLSQKSFAGLEAQIGTTYDALVTQGATGQEALMAMQPDLQTAWEMEQEYGYKVDDATQKLIDQGVQTGLVGEKHKSATDQMIDGINKMDADLEKLIQHFEGISSAADTAAQNVQKSFDSVKVPNWNPSMPGGATVTSDQSGAPLTVTGPGSDQSGNPLIVGVGDAPLTAVDQAGLYLLKPGDIYGMPSLTPDLGPLNLGSPSLPAGGSGGGGGGGQVTFVIQAIDALSFRRWLAQTGGNEILKYFENNDGGGNPRSPLLRLQTLAVPR